MPSNRRQAKNVERLRQAEENRLRARVLAELQRLVAVAATAYAVLPSLIRSHEKMLRHILTQSSTRMALTAASQIRATVAVPLADQMGVVLPTQDELTARIAEIAGERAKERAKDVANTSRERIDAVVQRGIEAAESPAQISANIREAVGGTAEGRANTIARTETAVATQTGQYEEMQGVAESLGVRLTKTWAATEDERTRDSHSAADGQVVAFDEAFTVGDAELMYPSDPNGPPEEVINCRCAVLYAPE
jgi:uncharacterized protein with gpF-like domain